MGVALGKGLSKGRGSPRASPRPHAQGKGRAPRGLAPLGAEDPELAARIRTTNQQRAARGLPGICSAPWPVVDTFRTAQPPRRVTPQQRDEDARERLEADDVEEQDRRFAENVIPRPTAPAAAPPMEDDWGQSWRSPRPPSPAPQVPPSPARPPRPVDEELIRQFLAPSLDEMLVAQLVARESGEAEFDARNTRTFDLPRTRAYQTHEARHLVDWGQPTQAKGPKHGSDALILRLETSVSFHEHKANRRALRLTPEEWVDEAAADPNHPTSVFDSGTVPYLLDMPVTRLAERVTVVDGDLENVTTQEHFGTDAVTQETPLQTRVNTDRPIDYFGPLIAHPQARWNKVGDGRARQSYNSSYLLCLTDADRNWLSLLRPGEIIRLHCTGIDFPSAWPEFGGRSGYDQWRKDLHGEWKAMPWGKPVDRYPAGFPRMDPLVDFWSQKERGFVTLRVTRDASPSAVTHTNPNRLIFIGLEPAQARPKCKAAIAAEGGCDCLHCRLQTTSMEHLRFLVGLHMTVVYRLEVNDIPVTLEEGTIQTLIQQYKVDDKDRGAYRRNVTPAPVRSRSRSRSRSRAAARRRSRSRSTQRKEWRHPTDAGSVRQERLNPDRPLPVSIGGETFAASGATGLARRGLTELAASRTREFLYGAGRRGMASPSGGIGDDDRRRVRSGPGDLDDPGDVLPAQGVSAALGLIAEHKGDGDTPAEYKPFLRDVHDIPDDQLTWPEQVRHPYRDDKWAMFCHPWNHKWSTNYRTQWRRYVPSDRWADLGRPTASGQEFAGERGRCGAGRHGRLCGMSHLCNFCVCPKTSEGSPEQGVCQGLTIVMEGNPPIVMKCCTDRDRCHGAWTHLGLDSHGQSIRYPLYQEALDAQRAHARATRQADEASEPVQSAHELQEQATALLAALKPDEPDEGQVRAEETRILRSALGVGRHPDAEPSPTVVPYASTTINELVDDVLSTVKRLSAAEDLDSMTARSTRGAMAPDRPTAQLTEEELLRLVPPTAVTPADDGTHRREVAVSEVGDPVVAPSPGSGAVTPPDDDPVLSEQPWYNQVQYHVEDLDLTAEEHVRHSARTLARRFQATETIFDQMSPVQRQWVTVCRVRGGPADLAVDLAEYASRKGLVAAPASPASTSLSGWNFLEAMASLEELALKHHEAVTLFQSKWRSYQRGAGFHRGVASSSA